jgi:hypothetical protein
MVTLPLTPATLDTDTDVEVEAGRTSAAPPATPSSSQSTTTGLATVCLPSEEWHRQLTTLEGWREFTTTATTAPVLLSEAAWTGLDEQQQIAYDDQRLDYHTRLTVLGTSTLRQVITTGRRLTLLNRHTISGRRGLILSGPAGTGKTTALTAFGKTHEAMDRQHYPGRTYDRIPVVYVTVPPAATPRMLAVEFTRFLGLPAPSRANITDVIEAACGVMIDARTSAVCVDELHNLKITSRAGAEVADTLKYLSERIPATFILSGINLEREGLFSGTRGQQIAGRFTMIRTHAFPYGDEWQGLIAGLEEVLRLHRQQPGTLPALDRYLHQRTSGMIGSLSHLIRGAAIEAILSGTEQVTQSLLEAIDVDHAAEQQRHHLADATGQGPAA